jgi:hypothetical protein
MDRNVYVCPDCIEHESLKAVIRENAVSEECDFCGASSSTPIACEVHDVIERIRFAIYQEYASPDDETMYDPEEGDYAGDILEHTDVFSDIGFELANEKLFNRIVSSFWDERFCRIGMWAGSPSERFTDAWDGFKTIVKHQRRYTFWSIPDEECVHGIYEHHPNKILLHIAKAISDFDLNFIVQAGFRFWRVRVHENTRPLKIPDDLAAPSPDQAKYSNRMSPAGVPMFYGAEDFDTARQETVDPDDVNGKMVTGAAFVSTKPLVLLDLCALPRSVCFFNEWDSSRRFGLRFLREFQADLSKPIKKDGRQHVEYVPTQVFTEYIRYEYKSPNGSAYSGIRYPSSKTGKPCVVLFLDQEECLPPRHEWSKDQVLQLDKTSLTVIEEIR